MLMRMPWLIVSLSLFSLSLSLFGPASPAHADTAPPKVQQGADHEQVNPLYAQLVKTGIGPQQDAPREFALRLPAPTLPDQLSPAQEEAALRKVLSFSRGVHLAEFLEKRGDVIIVTDRHNRHSEWYVQQLDYYYIVEADLSVLRDKSLLNSLSSGDDAEGEELDAEALAARQLKLIDPERERYGAFEVKLPRGVKLYGAGRSYWSETADSVLTAACVLPSFLKDPEFPNRWERLEAPPAGEKLGVAGPFLAAATYMKITRLRAHPKLLLVEGHLQGLEPPGWYGLRRDILGSYFKSMMVQRSKESRRKIERAMAKAERRDDPPKVAP